MEAESDPAPAGPGRTVLSFTRSLGRDLVSHDRRYGYLNTPTSPVNRTFFLNGCPYSAPRSDNVRQQVGELPVIGGFSGQ